MTAIRAFTRSATSPVKTRYPIRRRNNRLVFFFFERVLWLITRDLEMLELRRRVACFICAISVPSV
jgi:hypothetical protein